MRQAEAALEQAGRDMETLVARSWHGVETARRQFLLLEANLVAAQENVRVQSVGFREGEAAAAAVIDAQVALSVAQTRRAAAAFEYDVRNVIPVGGGAFRVRKAVKQAFASHQRG